MVLAKSQFRNQPIVDAVETASLAVTVSEENERVMSERVLGNLSTAILLLDENACVIFANQAAENLLKESSAQLTGRKLVEFIANAHDLMQLVESASQTQALYTGRQMHLELPGRENVTVDATTTPLLDLNQVLIELIPMDRYLRIDRDAAIKDHHQVTRQMVRGLAHEIKNPLGGIRGSAQLLSRELPDADLQDYTNIIIEETDRLTALVDRMLGPRSLPNKNLCNIHEILERVAKLLELEADAQVISLTVARDYDPSIPDLIVDAEMMLQAILNVARNAMQCLEGTPLPTITFNTRIERQFTIAGKRHRVVLKIEISDNGPGIPEEIQEHLFYPMISRRPGGTGLGLTFAQNIVSQHEGMIEFDSEPGATTFRLFIPLE